MLQNLRPEHLLSNPKPKSHFHRDRVYQSNTLFGCTSIYKSSPLSLKMKKKSLRLAWIICAFAIFTKASLSFHLPKEKAISGQSRRGSDRSRQ